MAKEISDLIPTKHLQIQEYLPNDLKGKSACLNNQTHLEHFLYLAVPIFAYESFFQRDLPKAAIKQYQLN